MLRVAFMFSKKPVYERILLKLSGEALMGDQPFGLDTKVVERIADEIKDVKELGVEVCVVIGGGNIFRGISGASHGMDRTQADYMGMLATVINCLAMQNALERIGVHTRVMSAIPMNEICEPYIKRRADHHMEKGRVVIFAAGTGNPYFTTDSAAALRASEMKCDVLLKASMVDGIYSADPKKDKAAVRYDHLTYLEVLAKDLKVMDASAISLARDNDIPVIVFSLGSEGELAKIMVGDGKYTKVSNE